VSEADIAYREFGFGKAADLDTSAYLLKIPKDEFVSLMQNLYDGCIEELKQDDEITGEFDPPFPGADAYPPPEDFVESHRQAFAEFFRIYFETDFLSLLFSNRGGYRYIINSVDHAEVGEESVIIGGEVFRRDDVRRYAGMREENFPNPNFSRSVPNHV
jgi:hypothetical protein